MLTWLPGAVLLHPSRESQEGHWGSESLGGKLHPGCPLFLSMLSGLHMLIFWGLHPQMTLSQGDSSEGHVCYGVRGGIVVRGAGLLLVSSAWLA